MEWFIVGGLGFWLATIVLLGLWIAAVENERSFWATICVVAWFAGLQFLSQVDLWTWLKGNVDLLALFVVSYFVLGAVWGIVKWYLFVKKAALDSEEKYRDFRMAFLRRSGVPDATLETQVPGNLRKAWQTELNERRTYYSGGITVEVPVARQHKGTILNWMTFWPASLTWTLLNDPVRAAFRHIYSHIARTLQDISNRAFADMKNLHQADITEEAPEPVPAADKVEASPPS